MKTGASKFFIFVFALVCVGLCVVCASLLSSAITVTSVSSQASFSKFKLYAISLGSYVSESAAQEFALETKQKGGAGYVYEKDGVSHVLASAYEKENDAKNVQENLLSSGISSTIVEIEIDEPSFSEASESQQKVFSAALAQLKSALLKLYDISVALDTKTIDETKAKIQIIEVKTSLETRLEKTTKGTTTIDGIFYQQIKNTFSEVENNLDELKNYENVDGISLSAKTKYAYIELLFELDDLISILNNDF